MHLIVKTVKNVFFKKKKTSLEEHVPGPPPEGKIYLS